MATPAVEAKLEAEGLRYLLGIGTNRVFERRVAAHVTQAQARYDRTGRPVLLRTSFRHRARSWPHHRRILVKIDVTAQGLDVRFMVTNRCGPAADLIAWYDDRGASENWIKELKLDLHADRLSCHRFRANAFRLQPQHRPVDANRRRCPDSCPDSTDFETATAAIRPGHGRDRGSDHVHAHIQRDGSVTNSFVNNAGYYRDALVKRLE